MQTRTFLFSTDNGMVVTCEGDYIFNNWLTTNGGAGSTIRMALEYANAGKPLRVVPDSGVLAHKLRFDTEEDCKAAQRTLVEYRMRDDIPSVREAVLRSLT
jgi:hypothetical protein